VAPRKSLDRSSSDRGATAATTWDPENGVFLPAERRSKGIDKTALCVQITLCIVVAALLFSVIALPRLRSSGVRMQGLHASRPTVERS
jgi:hypothetical protein